MPNYLNCEVMPVDARFKNNDGSVKYPPKTYNANTKTMDEYIGDYITIKFTIMRQYAWQDGVRVDAEETLSGQEFYSDILLNGNDRDCEKRDAVLKELLTNIDTGNGEIDLGADMFIRQLPVDGVLTDYSKNDGNVGYNLFRLSEFNTEIEFKAAATATIGTKSKSILAGLLAKANEQKAAQPAPVAPVAQVVTPAVLADPAYETTDIPF